MKHFLYHLILGSNLGDRVGQIKLAKRLIFEQIGSIESESALYETQPWGHAEQPWFINQAISTSSPLEPALMLYAIKKIEKEVGRKPAEKWHERHIDIDIILAENTVVNDEKLTLPHPLFHLRNFTLIPLMEIGANLMHPLLGKTVEELFAESRDMGEVFIYNQDEQDNTV